MTQKEKLIELLSEHHSGNYNEAQRIADYLLANGVFVLPCKVGDTLYRIIKPKYTKPFVWSGVDTVEVIGAGYRSPFGGFSYVSVDDFGKNAFLTREEAEAALKKMEENE